MRSILYIFLVGFLLGACKDKPKQEKNASNDATAMAAPAGMKGVEQWLSAWEFVSTQLFELPSAPAPAILLYDDSCLYTTSAVSAPDSAQAFEGPAMLGQAPPWKWARHKGELIIPDSAKVPVGLMSFAAADKNGQPFFVMAAPGFWQSAGVASKELGLDKLMTAVFLHEFTHTRQQTGMGAMVDSIERQHTFKDPELSDDIVQHLFRQDSQYVRLFRAEVDQFYKAAFAADTPQVKQLAREGLRLLKQRQATYFKKDKAVLKSLDDIFLTMEGLGQYAGYYWLHHPKGANIPYAVAVEGMRRKRNQWSQEEGLALFLVLEKLSRPRWDRDLFGKEPKSIIALLTAAVQ